MFQVDTRKDAMNRQIDKSKNNFKEKTYRGRLVAALVLVILTIVLETVYFVYHISDNRDNVLQAYEDEQSQTVGILAGGLKGMAEDEMVDLIRQTVPVSGSTWGFLISDSGVSYMKDEDTTKSLEYICLLYTSPSPRD